MRRNTKGHKPMADNAEQLNGVGEHYGWDDARGWLTFSGLPAELQRQMDQTQNADYERRHWRPSVHRTRPATDAEKLLLTYLGFNVPDNLQTSVKYISAGIRRLTWPTLENQLETLR
jgi:hypothetical protein